MVRYFHINLEFFLYIQYKVIGSLISAYRLFFLFIAINKSD